MTRKEFARLTSIAKRGRVYEEIDEIWDALAPFDGCALHKNRFFATEKQMINWIRYSALMLNGEWDMSELETCAYIARRIDLITD